MDAVFVIHGLSQSMGQTLRREAEHLAGVQAAHVDPRAGLLLINGEGSEQAWLEMLKERAARVGLRVQIELPAVGEGVDAEAVVKRFARLDMQWRLLVTIDGLGLLALAGLLMVYLLQGQAALTEVFQWIAVGCFGLGILLRIFFGLREERRFSESLWMPLGAVWLLLCQEPVYAACFLGANALCAQAEAAIAYVANRRRGRLAACIPETAQLSIGEAVVKRLPEQIPPGASVIVGRNERFPVDGYILSGTTTIDATAMTGEAETRTARTSDSVYAGFLNQGDKVTVAAVRFGGMDSLLMHLIDPVDIPPQRGVAIIGLSRLLAGAGGLWALLLVLVPLFSGGEWLRPQVALVLAAAGSMRLSGFVRTLYRSATASAAFRGIRTHALALSRMGHVQQMLFERAGVVQFRNCVVTSVLYVQGYSREDVLTSAAIAEAYSNHPMAFAVLEANQGAPSLAPLEGWQEIRGEGVQAKYAGHTLTVGNPRLMKRVGVKHNSPQNGLSAHVALDSEYIGTLYFGSRMRDDTSELIPRLKRLSVRRTHLLTGDSRETAVSVASSAGMDYNNGNLTDEDKIQIFNERQELGAVACVVDGMGDSPLLAECPEAIAMEGACDEAQTEIASAFLTRISDGMKLGRSMGFGILLLALITILAKGIGLLPFWFGNLPLWLPAAAEAACAIAIFLFGGSLALKGKKDREHIGRRIRPPEPMQVSAEVSGDIPAMPGHLAGLSPEQRERALQDEITQEERRAREAAEEAEMQKKLKWKAPE